MKRTPMLKQRQHLAGSISRSLACFLLFYMYFLPASAQNIANNYTFLIASGFLCDPGDSSACPAVAKSSQGDTFELTGAGMFNTQNKSLTATGAYTHRSPNGTVLETGVWTGEELESFSSYGVSPTAFKQLNLAVGPERKSPRGVPFPAAVIPSGGLAKLKILLLPVSAPPAKATLQLNCALGDIPRERSVEGIRLTLEKADTDFSEELHGRIMFLATQPVHSQQRSTTPTLN